MYASCGCPGDARAVFDRMPQHDVVSLVSMMLGYVENDQPDQAMVVFFCSSGDGVRHSEACIVAALKACSSLASRAVEGAKLVEVLETGMGIHSRAREDGIESAQQVSSSLIGFYSACGDMSDARKVFDRMKLHSVVSWNSLIHGYADNGDEDLALDLYMLLESGAAGDGIDPDARTLGAALKACAAMAAKEVGKEVDGEVLKTKSLERAIGFRARGGLDLFAANSLVDLLGKCGAMVESQRTFDKMPCHSAVSWTALILGYVENNEGKLALETFSCMQSPDALAFVAAIKACIVLAERETGKQVQGRVVKLESMQKCMEIHARAARSGCDGDLLVATSLVHAYSTCGSVLDSREVFDRAEFHSVVSWTALMRAHAENAEEELSLGMFSRMELAPTAVTYVAALQACSALSLKLEIRKDHTRGRRNSVEFLGRVRALHSHAATAGFESDIFVASGLIQLYMDCGSLGEARQLFDRLPVHNLVLWNAMMLGYAENGEAAAALEIFSRMLLDNDPLLPDERSVMAALRACGSLVDLEAARGIHGRVVRSGMEQDEHLLASLVDAYGKCGSMIEARHTFDSSSRGAAKLELWNALIGGYSCQGNLELTMELLDRMRDEQLEPNGITAASVLAACSHAGAVETGKAIFASMAARFGIVPRAEHCLCVIDMLGRAKQLDAAVKMAEAMPVEKRGMAWTSVLSSCKKWKNVELAEVAFESLMQLEEEEMDHPASYVLMAGTYEGRWEKR